ncbi:hypothetical protein Tco_0671911 [Tanacetum coccineum]
MWTDKSRRGKGGSDCDGFEPLTLGLKLTSSNSVDTFLQPLRGGVEEEQLGFLLSRMNGLILTNIPGRWVGSLKATGEFSVKSVRQLIDDSILPKEEVATRWVKVMPIKINVFAWRVRLDKLPTRLNLSLKDIGVETNWASSVGHQDSLRAYGEDVWLG